MVINEFSLVSQQLFELSENVCVVTVFIVQVPVQESNERTGLHAKRDRHLLHLVERRFEITAFESLFYGFHADCGLVRDGRSSQSTRIEILETKSRLSALSQQQCD